MNPLPTSLRHSLRGTAAAFASRHRSGIRHSTFVIAFLCLAWLGYRLAAPPSPPAIAAIQATPPAPPTTTLTDPVEIFQKAFWKRPTAKDHILHAERREWSGKDGISKWQWFIAVQPSPELIKHLRDDNAFSLSPATTLPATPGAPEWFTFQPEAVDALRSPSGGLTLAFSKTGDTLFATDQGGGLRAGLPEAAPTLPTVVHNGRLPNTPPPRPAAP